MAKNSSLAASFANMAVPQPAAQAARTVSQNHSAQSPTRQPSESLDHQVKISLENWV